MYPLNMARTDAIPLAVRGGSVAPILIRNPLAARRWGIEPNCNRELHVHVHAQNANPSPFAKTWTGCLRTNAQ